MPTPISITTTKLATKATTAVYYNKLTLLLLLLLILLILPLTASASWQLGLLLLLLLPDMTVV